MTSVEVAVAYLVLAFPGQPHALAVLPMKTEDICWREARELEEHYKGRSKGIEVFAHCVINWQEKRPN